MYRWSVAKKSYIGKRIEPLLGDWLYTGMKVYGTLITMGCRSFIHADCRSHDFVSLSTPRMS